MDLSYFRRTGASIADDRWAAAPDYPMLVATLAALQAASAAARAEAGHARAPARAPHGGEPLVDILLATASWRESVSAQGGSFHRVLARVPAKDL
ncbi:MAG TPA: hypothetical protein VGW34_13735 [Allosphingosinicella sp.]|nr:hypothetical protein [Allosphingosinicella sp.]